MDKKAWVCYDTARRLTLSGFAAGKARHMVFSGYCPGLPLPRRQGCGIFAFGRERQWKHG